MKLLNTSIFCVIFILLSSCSSTYIIQQEMKKSFAEILRKRKEAEFNPEIYLPSLVGLPVDQREDSILNLMYAGKIPARVFDFKKVSFESKDSAGKILKVSIWVSPDYLSIGNDTNFIRMPLTPQTAQKVAHHFNCVLPTTKMVDEIYKAAQMKLVPLPLTEGRDSLPTFLQHNQLIEAQLAGKKSEGIIAGIKKDVVQSMAVLQNSKQRRVAIYGWHTLAGKPIQPLYTGHVDWYVDYSHGVRLVYEKMLIDNKIYLVEDVLNNPLLAKSICQESTCAAMRYIYFPKLKLPAE